MFSMKDAVHQFVYKYPEIIWKADAFSNGSVTIVTDNPYT